MRLGFWLPALLATWACKPQQDTVKKQVRLTTAPPAALTDAAVATAIPPSRDLLAEVAKAIIGLDPSHGDRHDHIGLANIAALVGYDLPLNDCGSPWLVSGSSSGESAAFILTITSNHNRGVGPTCGETAADAPVKYLFTNWTAHADGLVWQPFPASGTVAERPLPQGQSNAATLSATKISLDAQGRQVWTSQESLTVQSASRSAGETLSLQFKRTLPAAAVARLASQNVAIPTPRYGVSAVTANKEPAAPDSVFNYSVGLLAAPALATAECKVDILVPPGCLYKSTLTAQFRQSKSRFLAQLHLAPTAVGLVGRLGSQAPCNHLTFRQGDGSCGGTMGPERTGVASWFGRSGVGLDFAQDMAAQASARQSDSGGVWDFAAMRLMPGQQSQDIPTVDWALRYFQLGTFAKVEALFEQLGEQIDNCRVHTELLPGAAAACQAPPADQTLQLQVHDY